MKYIFETVVSVGLLINALIWNTTDEVKYVVFCSAIAMVILIYKIGYLQYKIKELQQTKQR